MKILSRNESGALAMTAADTDATTGRPASRIKSSGPSQLLINAKYTLYYIKHIFNVVEFPHRLEYDSNGNHGPRAPHNVIIRLPA